MLSLGLGVALLVALLAVDAVVWRLIRRPLAAFLLTIPFVFSAAITAALGSVAVPLLGQLKARQITRAEGPASHAVKAGTPTMGGIYFVPTGVLVAWAASGAPPEVVGAAAATLLFMALGALDDGLMLLRKHNYGLPGRIKFLIQVTTLVPTPLSFSSAVCAVAVLCAGKGAAMLCIAEDPCPLLEQLPCQVAALPRSTSLPMHYVPQTPVLPILWACLQ